MTICNDIWITNQSETHDIIKPYSSKLIRSTNSGPIISYGQSSYGYDIRCTKEFKLFTNTHAAVIDPKNFSDKIYTDIVNDFIIIPPNSFALGTSLEYIKMPTNVIGVCVGKSTYARCGLIVNVTPIEPGWEGNITLEFSNTTPLPVKVYANEGVAQLIFHKGDQCKETYETRKGKYQGQTGITLPRV